MAEFRMPSLGAEMEKGTLVEWRVKPGDAVTRGQIVAVVETDKGTIEVEIFEDGVVDSLLVEPGTKVPVGTPLAVVRGKGEPAAAVAAASAPAPSAAKAPPPAAPEAGRTRASPLARKRAEALGLDLGRMTGTGTGGTITVADVEAAAAAGASGAGGAAGAGTGTEKATEADRQAAMRRAIGAAMSRSKREIPHYYLATDIELSRMLAWLATHNAGVPVARRMLPAAPLLKAVALALMDVPELNGFFTDGAFRPSDVVHLGVAISLRQGGLVAPAIHDAGRRTVAELMDALRDLIARVRAGTIRSSELADPTVTVSSLGDQGVREVLGVIFPPQVALVGLGRIGERPWVVEGAVQARPVITATLSADHRVSDGHRGGRFLAALDRLLQEPEKL
ncbi:MAG TPA: dihydrolipoamide acetyltransferase family protein [Gemmatimonadales bacterium]